MLLGFTPATCIWDWDASLNRLRETPYGSRKNPKAGRSPTYHLSTADINSHLPCRAHVVLCRVLEKSLTERLVRSTAWARKVYGIASVNQTWPHCDNQMGKAKSKPLAARLCRDTAWARHELAFRLQIHNHSMISIYRFSTAKVVIRSFSILRYMCTCCLLVK